MCLHCPAPHWWLCTVYPMKYAHGFVVLCFVVVMQSFIMNSHEVFIHIHQGYFAGTGAIVRLPQCQWSKPDGYGKISQCITTTKHSKAKTVCIFLVKFTQGPKLVANLHDMTHVPLTFDNLSDNTENVLLPAIFESKSISVTLYFPQDIFTIIHITK